MGKIGLRNGAGTFQSLFDKSWIKKEVREIMYLSFQKNSNLKFVDFRQK